MSHLDEMFMNQEREAQDLMDDQVHPLDEIKRARAKGFIDSITYMELVIKTPEYKDLKQRIGSA